MFKQPTDNGLNNQKGMNLVELMLATALFLAVMTIVAMTERRALDQMREAQFKITATSLLQQKMEETLVEFEDKPFSDIDFSGSSNGNFGEEFKNFTWKREVAPYHFDVKKAFALLGKAQPELEESAQFGLIQNYFDNISEFISDSAREITVTIAWKDGETERNIQATTHIVRYDKKINIQGVGI